MATPLRLKSERVGKVELTGESPYLSVLVDTGVFHLNHEYDYSLPAKFSLDVGDWVSVPFNGRNCLGLITKRSPKTSVAKVQPINRGAKGPKIPVDHLKFYRAVANRWAKNCGNCSVSQTEIETFLQTDKGDYLARISNLSGFILTSEGTWLLQQNGFQIIL